MMTTDKANPLNRNANDLAAWARAHKGLALAVCEARAFAELERERVDTYIRPIFESYAFTDEDGKAIAAPRLLYLCEDDAKCAAYYAECDRAHVANGWKGEEGHCPALTAEHLQVQAENALLDALAAFMGLGAGDFCRTLDLRAKSLDLALRACVSVPVGGKS